MAKYNVNWLAKKNEDWIMASLKDGEKEYKDVSINRVNKKGETFPGFDDLQPGRDVEGELWESPSHKWYLFAPRPESTRGGAGGAFKQAQIEKTMDKKNEFIGKTLDRKEDSIRLAGAQRDAVLIVTTRYNDPEMSIADFKNEILKWRDWFLTEFNKDIPPF